MWNLERNGTKKLTYKTETHGLRKQTYGCWGKGILKEFGKVMYTLLYSKWKTNTDLLNNTRNSVQCHVAAWVGGEAGRCLEKTNACTCMAESLHRSPEAIMALSTSYVLSGLSCPTLCNPMVCSPPDSSVSGDFPGKNTGVHCHALLQGNRIGGGGGGFCIAGRFFTS